jgi:hypothetical protein
MGKIPDKTPCGTFGKLKSLVWPEDNVGRKSNKK